MFSLPKKSQTIFDYLNTMKTMALEIRELADKEDDFVTVNEFEDHITEYNKHIWFVKSMLA